MLNIILLCSLVLNSSPFCFGVADIPFFNEVRLCPERLRETDEAPDFEIDESSSPFGKRQDTVFFPDLPITLPYLPPFSGANDQDIQFVSGEGSPDTELSSHLHLKKRSASEYKDRMKENTDSREQYEARFLSPLLREIRNKASIKTIQLPSSFTPRLGRKRSGEIEGHGENDRHKVQAIAGRSRVIDLKAGNAFTPRLGRSEETNRFHMLAGNAFTPRLTKSETSNRIHFSAGNAFTPRLGRAEGTSRVLLNAGSAFTPRLGRSGKTNWSLRNAGSAYNSRFGKPETDNHMHLSTGSDYISRLGRSEGSRMFLNAGSSFTPRLGRSEGRNQIQLSAGNAFTPRLG